MAQGARQHGAVDAASGSTGNDVDDDAQLEGPPDIAQELEVDSISIVFGVLAIDLVEK
jgi:hypothetical protein